MDSASDNSDSTTLSQFVKLRATGEIPLLGGNPYNGLRDLGAAARGSTPVGLSSAVANLATAARELALATPAYSMRFPRGYGSSSGPESPITMLDNDLGDMASAACIDDEKLKVLLASSDIDMKDLRRYMTLLRIARDGVRKKESAVAQRAVVKHAKDSFAPLVTDDMLLADFEANAKRIADVKALLRVEFTAPGMDLLLLRAITHDSYYTGKECNRVLAYIGDAAARLYASTEMMAVGRSVADVSAQVTVVQSNDSLRTVAVQIGLVDYLRVAVNVDTAARAVAATAMEAVIGVVFQDGGLEALRVLNDTVKFYAP